MGAGVAGDATREREATLGVDRGLFLLRYVSGALGGPSPVAIVRPAEGFHSLVEILSSPGVVNGFLSGPGECAVIRAEKPARLTVRIKASAADGALDASFRVEPVSGASQPPGVADAAPDTRSSPYQLVAHVARRGDLAVAPGVWAAGPDAPAAIEGIGILGALPEGVEVEIQPLVATRPPRWLDWAPPGGFVGTRGRALPLAGLRFRLSGARAGEFRISAEALFLGSSIMSRSGREIDFVSPGGNDPLVGLRFALLPEMEGTIKEGFVAPAPALAEAGVAERQKEPRIRVFRASAGA